MEERIWSHLGVLSPNRWNLPNTPLVSKLIAEADENDAITRYYLYGASLLAMALPDGTAYGYQFDPNGNAVTMADQNAYAYDPFGAVANQQETVAQPFKFAGQYGVMVYYMKARFYDPKVGRFISEDPSGFAGGDVDLAEYVKNNRINLTDPTGLCAVGAGTTSYSNLVQPISTSSTFLDKHKTLLCLLRCRLLPNCHMNKLFLIIYLILLILS